jgi:hypothetical protein
VQLLGTLTPIDAHLERTRLIGELRERRRTDPRWTYAATPHDELRRALEAAEHRLARETDPLTALYRARVRELSLEAALCAAAGTSGVERLAQERFASKDADAARAASKLCAAWLAEPAGAAAGPSMASDDPDPRSLLSRMRAAVGRLRLPFAVVAAPSLAPLAATGERVIFVAAGRAVHEEDSLRTVLHEIEGHAYPRTRSLSASLALFRAGTARGIDDQEGRALALEERGGHLGPRRRRQLAARHRAVERMLEGATFAEVAAELTEAHGLDTTDAVVVAERVFRGSDGKRPGLGRERVYLDSLIRVRAHLAAHPRDEAVLASGQVSLDSVDTLRAYSAN